MQLGAQRLEVLVGGLSDPLSNSDGSSHYVLSFGFVSITQSAVLAVFTVGIK